MGVSRKRPLQYGRAYVFVFLCECNNIIDQECIHDLQFYRVEWEYCQAMDEFPKNEYRFILNSRSKRLVTADGATRSSRRLYRHNLPQRIGIQHPLASFLELLELL